MNCKVLPPAEPGGFHLCNVTSTYPFAFLSPGSSGQVQLLAVPLQAWVSSPLVDSWLLSVPFPHFNSLILLLDQAQLHLLESPSWKLS